MNEPQHKEVKAQADHALAILDAMADKWVEEVRLVDSIKHVSHVTRELRQDAPDAVREHFIGRQEAPVLWRKRHNGRAPFVARSSHMNRRDSS